MAWQGFSSYQEDLLEVVEVLRLVVLEEEVALG